jgi:uncharacterized protein YcnI
MGENQMRRTLIVASALGGLWLPAAASAHVSLHPNTLPAASNPTIDIRVPNEEDRANVVKVDMQVPPGFLEISTELPTGWRATVLKRKLATPQTTDSGPVTEEISEVIWSASQKGGIPPGSFLQFPITTAIPDSAVGQTLSFKVIQTYSDGDVVRWIEAPDSAGHPAPTVNVTAKGGALEDVAGSEAGPGPPTGAGAGAVAPAGTKAVTVSKGASRSLGIAALIVGALGLLAGIAALASARVPRA